LNGWQRIEELRRKTGHPDAVFGTRVSRVQGGPGHGIEVVSLWNAAGLRLEVLVDRGFDLFALEHRGRRLDWQGPPGLRSRVSYEPQGWGWLRNFHGGLLVTCGLDHVLFPQDRKAPEYDFLPEMERHYGLHGRIANEAGELIERRLIDVGGEPVLRLRGLVLQAAIYHERLALERVVDVPVFRSLVRLRDTVTNIGYKPTHHEILYHLNFGYPLVDAGAKVHVPTGEVIEIAALERDAPEVVTAHEPPAHGPAAVRLENPQAGLELSIRYDPTALPYCFVWNMRAEGINAIGLEPSSARRADDRSEELLDLMEPGAAVDYELDIEISEQ
jgi:hypothetical protein